MGTAKEHQPLRLCSLKVTVGNTNRRECRRNVLRKQPEVRKNMALCVAFHARSSVSRFFLPYRPAPTSSLSSLSSSSSFSSRGGGELRTQKLKSHPARTQSLNVPPLKPGVVQYIAIHVTLTARDFFLAYFYPSGPFTCIIFPNLSRFLLCWLWLTHGSCVVLQNEIGHPAGCRFPC